MKTPQVLATVAVAAGVACFATLNMNAVSSGQGFLATPFTDAEREFINFIATHKRSYATKEEYEHRLALFTESYNIVKNHDSSVGFRLGINHLADLSEAEYKQMLGYKFNPNKERNY